MQEYVFFKRRILNISLNIWIQYLHAMCMLTYLFWSVIGSFLMWPHGKKAYKSSYEAPADQVRNIQFVSSKVRVFLVQFEFFLVCTSPFVIYFLDQLQKRDASWQSHVVTSHCILSRLLYNVSSWKQRNSAVSLIIFKMDNKMKFQSKIFAYSILDTVQWFLKCVTLMWLSLKLAFIDFGPAGAWNK